ncbi:hypothetical protein THITH_04200 [Thioalkalivibrio paradoxus ARh 1]|uniref:DUF5666 domain-containing protein n=1 Tax=Thioalkalivibrio paradoxus ARh 1 TaxID=713585 RepID=W0DSG1_9GAMM|nr:hypothetical protein THITH_04200 [Thioalkalivibrio paradoxus ARh 1]
MVVALAAATALWACGSDDPESASREQAAVEQSDPQAHDSASPDSKAGLADERVRPRDDRRAQNATEGRDSPRGEHAPAADLNGEVTEVGEDWIVLRLADRAATGDYAPARQRELREPAMTWSGETATVQFSAATRVRMRGTESDGRRAQPATPGDIKVGDRVAIWFVEDSGIAERISVRRASTP